MYDLLNNKVFEIKKGRGWSIEYDNIKYRIIFEGEYKNGERNGKGKEYDYPFSNLIFEGEYYNDWQFKGKSYVKGKLEYEGQFLFNKKWDGKGYDEFGNIIYELHNGNGKVREYYQGELIFEGEYLNGKRNGKGKEYYFGNGKLKFEAEYLNGKRLE